MRTNNQNGWRKFFLDDESSSEYYGNCHIAAWTVWEYLDSQFIAVLNHWAKWKSDLNQSSSSIEPHSLS